MKGSLAVASLWLVAAIAATAWAEDAGLADLFRERHAVGTMVIASLDGTRVFVHDEERAAARFAPAATFDIVSTLIALEEGAVADENQSIAWDGADNGEAAWNRDQSIDTAFSCSCFWFFQRLARRIGMQKYASLLRSMQYGNAKTGREVTDFWLHGELAISAMEQVAFLKELYWRQYPFKSASYAVVRRLMVVDRAPGRTIRAKSGWARAVSPQVGWCVGSVETGRRVWLFAMNLETDRAEDGCFLRDFAFEALRRKGIMEATAGNPATTARARAPLADAATLLASEKEQR